LVSIRKAGEQISLSLAQKHKSNSGANMKVFFAGDTFNRRNLGCRATTLALKSMILGCSEIYYSLDFKDLSKQVLPSAGKSYPLKLVYQAIEKFQTKILQQSSYPLKYSDFSGRNTYTDLYLIVIYEYGNYILIQ